MSDQLINIDDLGKQLKVPPKTIRNKLSNGTWPLPPIRIGRALRWRQSDVDRLIDRGTNRSGGEPHSV
jgi:predicted DNA-binding transcriptional regulator AlpA